MQHPYTRVCLLVALAGLLASCDEGDGLLKLLDDDAEDLSGSWRQVLTQTENTCGFSGVGDGVHIVNIAQAATDVTIDCVDLCGDPFCHLSGTVSGRTLMSRYSNSSPAEYLFCYDNFEFMLAGSLHMDTVQGSITQRYFRAGVLCPAELHTSCTITYAFEWTRCPPADCTIQNCLMTSPVSPLPRHPSWGQ